MNEKSENSECCPKFDPALWNEKTFEWNNKKFILDKVFTLLYIPVNFGSVMTRVTEQVRKAGGVFQEGMALSEHTSRWNMDIYLAVDKEISGAENKKLSGKFFSKVYEGDFKETGKWQKDFENYLKTKNLKTRKIYLWYTTCPKCAKKYGKNYVVFLANLT